MAGRSPSATTASSTSRRASTSTPADAQDLTSPRGKIHRINKDGTIPTDNPFYDGAGPNWTRSGPSACAIRTAPTTTRRPAGCSSATSAATTTRRPRRRSTSARAARTTAGRTSRANCSAPCTSPIYSYAHNGRDAAVTGGFVYHGTQFPAVYQGSYFFADYTQNWIKRLTFDANGNVTGVLNFEPADGAVDGPYGDIVYLTEGPDGALYYLDLGYSDISGTFGVSKLRRIRYVQSEPCRRCAAVAPTPTSGPTPLDGHLLERRLVRP